MKKRIAVLLVITLTAELINAENKTEKVGPINKNLEGNYYIMDGFQFLSYEKSSMGLETIVNNEIEKIKKDATRKGENYSIVGYSQGGVRSLAYAKMLKEKYPEEYKKLDAVITVSGIDKGIKALDGGFGRLKSVANNDVDILWGGVNSFAASLLPAIEGVVATIIFANNRKEIENWLIGLTSNVGEYISCAWNGGTEEELKEIYDMMPQSEFINRNVSETEKVYYKRIVGYNSVWVWHCTYVWFVPVWYFTVEKEPIYQTFVSYKDKPKFDEEFPVGYIVGADSNTLGFLDETVENSARKTIRAAAALLDNAGIAHTARSLDLIHLALGSAGHARNCFNAARWLYNVDGELNEIKGSSENDGLVAKESQFYPKTFYNPATNKIEEVHSRVLSENEYGYKEFSEYNHKTIDPSVNTDIIDEIKSMLIRANRR